MKFVFFLFFDAIVACIFWDWLQFLFWEVWVVSWISVQAGENMEKYANNGILYGTNLPTRKIRQKWQKNHFFWKSCSTKQFQS